MEEPTSTLPVITGEVSQSKMQIGFCTAVIQNETEFILFAESRDELGRAWANTCRGLMNPMRVYPVVIAQMEFFKEAK